MLVCEHGTVIKRYADGRVNALLANSNVGSLAPGAEGWVWTNSKGKRILRKHGKWIKLGDVSVNRVVEPETGEDITTR